MSINELRGPIPDALDSLWKLRELKMGDNELSGPSLSAPRSQKDSQVINCRRAAEGATE